MSHNQRNDEIRDNIEHMRRNREAYADALATVEQFNARLSAKKSTTEANDRFCMVGKARATGVAGAHPPARGRSAGA